MTSVITGDIINSRKTLNKDLWLIPLKQGLNKITTNDSMHQIFRGDSFQLEIEDVSKSFIDAVYLKSCIKSIKGFDVRLAIGLGKKDYQGKNVSESSGSAFIYSGEAFKRLKTDKVNLKIMSDNIDFEMEMNLYFKLALIAMDNWTTNSAEIVKLSLENPTMIQAELANLIGISQNAVSKRQKRAYLDEILELNSCYKYKLEEI